MNPSVYLLFYSGIVILLVVMYIRGARRQGPSRLRFGPRGLPDAADSASQIQLVFSSQAQSQNSAHQPSRQLNIFFNYNGESFDAYEILGVPAGCSLRVAHAQYLQLSSGKSPAERHLYDAAILAVEKTSDSTGHSPGKSAGRSTGRPA